ncbi:MAG: Crp/Fnr family transcriptional regulator [Thermomicrobia bacterium]|nr:Crp/Fnr family transcriptional regulator [Thermomicrobia bacterium]
MSELLARTLARALPLFARRWQDEARDRGIPEPFVIAGQESPWLLLVDAVRSGEYRPAAVAIRRGDAHVSDPDAALRAQTSLLAECVRTVYDGDPHDFAALLREMDAVWDILMQAATEAPNAALPAPPLVDALDRTVGIVPFITTEYAPGQTIRTREDTDPILYIVRSGRVRLAAPLPDGRMVIVAILREGDTFGTTDARTPQRATAEAMTHSSVTLLHASGVPALVRIVPEAANALVASLAAQLSTAHRMIAHALGYDTSIRLIALLLALADTFGEPANDGTTLIAYPATHQDLAAMIGANRVTVTRKLTELQKATLIIPERRNMMRVDVAGLTALLDE